MHETEAGERRKDLKIVIRELKKDIRALEKINGMCAAAQERRDKLERLEAEALALKREARLEDLQVWRGWRTWTCIETGKKYKNEYWWACWRGKRGQNRTAYIGSCRKMGREEAMEKARKMKEREV